MKGIWVLILTVFLLGVTFGALSEAPETLPWQGHTIALSPLETLQYHPDLQQRYPAGYTLVSLSVVLPDTLAEDSQNVGALHRLVRLTTADGREYPTQDWTGYGEQYTYYFAIPVEIDLDALGVTLLPEPFPGAVDALWAWLANAGAEAAVREVLSTDWLWGEPCEPLFAALPTMSEAQVAPFVYALRQVFYDNGLWTRFASHCQANEAVIAQNPALYAALRQENLKVYRECVEAVLLSAFHNSPPPTHASLLDAMDALSAYFGFTAPDMAAFVPAFLATPADKQQALMGSLRLLLEKQGDWRAFLMALRPYTDTAAQCVALTESIGPIDAATIQTTQDAWNSAQLTLHYDTWFQSGLPDITDRMLLYTPTAPKPYTILVHADAPIEPGLLSAIAALAGGKITFTLNPDEASLLLWYEAGYKPTPYKTDQGVIVYAYQSNVRLSCVSFGQGAKLMAGVSANGPMPGTLHVTPGGQPYYGEAATLVGTSDLAEFVERLLGTL